MADDLATQLKRAELALVEAKTKREKEETRSLRFEADAQAHMAELRRASEYEHRIYTFDSAVSDRSVAAAIGDIGLWVRRNPKKPIEIVFNSPGGGVFAGLALYDFLQEIREAGTKVDTFALGMAASMGGILLQAGEKRIMSRHAYMLIHEVSSGAFGNISEMEDELKFSKRLQDRLLGILAERSSFSKAQIARRWKKKDWWLDSDECLKHGFVDEVR
jgi:ATP-dependent Clp protease protease subunit